MAASSAFSLTPQLRCPRRFVAFFFASASVSAFASFIYLRIQIRDMRASILDIRALQSFAPTLTRPACLTTSRTEK